jgi:hypothetical protein
MEPNQATKLLKFKYPTNVIDKMANYSQPNIDSPTYIPAMYKNLTFHD